MEFHSTCVGSSCASSVIIKFSSSVASPVKLPLSTEITQDDRFSLTNTLTTTRLQKHVKSSPKICHVKAMEMNSRFEEVSFQGWVPHKTCATWKNHIPRSTTKMVRATNKMTLLRCQATRIITMETENATTQIKLCTLWSRSGCPSM